MGYVPCGEIRVAVSGKSGCGNTTVSSMLAQRLGVKLINYTFRQMAAERGVPLADIIEAARNDDFYDRYVDTHQVELAEKESCVLGSRLAVWMLRNADLKVYLLADDETRAGRIFRREGGSLEQIREFTRMRDMEDSRRYLELYGIDNTDYSSADLVIDTASKTPEDIVCIILSELARRGLVSETED